MGDTNMFIIIIILKGICPAHLDPACADLLPSSESDLLQHYFPTKILPSRTEHLLIG